MKAHKEDKFILEMNQTEVMATLGALDYSLDMDTEVVDMPTIRHLAQAFDDLLKKEE